MPTDILQSLDKLIVEGCVNIAPLFTQGTKDVARQWMHEAWFRTTFNENVIYQGAIIRCGMDAVYSLARGRFWYLSGRELFKMKDAVCDVKIV